MCYLRGGLVFLLCSTLSMPLMGGESSKSLITAMKLMEKYQAEKWTYGSNIREKQTNCVLFVVGVLKMLGINSEKVVAATKIVDIKGDLQDAVENEAKETRGIQYALTDSGLGRVVEIENAAPGDFVQYWFKGKDGKWEGHAGVLEKVTSRKGVFSFTLIGAHKSMNGAGVLHQSLKISNCKIYLVRIK